MPIKNWSTTPASNNSNPPDGFPEGMAPSGYNDAARQVMADVRGHYDEIEWRDLGHTHVYASGTSTTIAGTDYTATYTASRRIRAVGSTTGTIYGTISSSSFSTNTTVNFTWDSGSLQNETLAISVGPAVTNTPIHVDGVEDAASLSGTSNFTGTLQKDGTAVATTVTTTRGDLIRRGASADERVALGTSGQALTSDGTDAVWGTINGVPTGAMMPFAGLEASLPTGWLLCYGQAVSQTTYADLYALLGTTYGSDAGGNFTLPDTRGTVIASPDDMGGTGASNIASSALDGEGSTVGDHNGSFNSNVVSYSGGGSCHVSAANNGIVQPTIGINWMIKT